MRRARVRRGRLVGHEQHGHVRPAGHVRVPEQHVQLVFGHGQPHPVRAVYDEHDGVTLPVHGLPHGPIPVAARHVGRGEPDVADCPPATPTTTTTTTQPLVSPLEREAYLDGGGEG